MFENGSIGLYAKALASAFAAAAVTALNAMANGDIDKGEWVTIAVAFVVGLGAVAAVPNFPESARKYLKAFVAAVVAAGGVLAVALISPAPLGAMVILKVILAALAALGITYAVPNAAESDPVDPVTHKIRPVRGKQSTLVSRSPGRVTDPSYDGRV